jgi:hypothetical protein
MSQDIIWRPMTSGDGEGRKGVGKFEEEAAAFALKRAKEAERKRRQRSGGYVLSVEVHLPSLARMLFAEGLLKEAELEDVAAISAATAAHLRKHQLAGRILPDLTPNLSKQEEMDRWLAEQDREENKAHHKKWAERLIEQGPGARFYHGPDVPPACRGDRQGQSGRNPAGKRVQYLGDMSIEKLGETIGSAKSGADLQGQEAKRIKPLAAKEIDAAVEKHEPLVPADESVHTIATGEGEVERELDRIEWDELGYAKRKAPPVTESDKDDPGNWS